MTDLLERTPVQDVLLDEQMPSPKVEPPPREERGIERPTARRPVRWIRWMMAVLVVAVGATVLAVALRSGGETTVLDTDGSFQAVETQRMEGFVPGGVIDLDGSFQAVETRRMERMEGFVPGGVIDLDGSFQAVETRRMEGFVPGGVIDLDGSFQDVETRRMDNLKPGN